MKKNVKEPVKHRQCFHTGAYAKPLSYKLKWRSAYAKPARLCQNGASLLNRKGPMLKRKAPMLKWLKPAGWLARWARWLAGWPAGCNHLSKDICRLSIGTLAGKVSMLKWRPSLAWLAGWLPGWLHGVRGQTKQKNKLQKS